MKSNRARKSSRKSPRKAPRKAPRRVPRKASGKAPRKTVLALAPVELIARRIFLIRDQKVMIDSDISELYGVPTKAFNQAVKRNAERFPPDFMFQLTADEADATASMRSQSVTASAKRNARFLPYAFTEQGVAMLSSVLHSARAIEINIAIMRTFVKMREMYSRHEDLIHELADVRRTQDEHGSHIEAIWDAIERLSSTDEPVPPKRQIGFQPN